MRWCLGLLVLGCACTAEPVESPAVAPKKAAEVKSVQPAKAPDSLAFAQGIVNPLKGAFKRFDGLSLAQQVWPRLSRFHALLNQDEPKQGVAIGMVLHYVSGREQGAVRGELDVAFLTGLNQQTKKRWLRVATYQTVAEPAGPLELVAVSSQDGLFASDTARFGLQRRGARLELVVKDGSSSWTRSFQRMDQAWALEPLQ